MSSPYSSYGFETLRTYARNTFTHLALVDDTGSEITRIDVTSDSRVQNTPDPSTNPLTYVVEIKGGDSGIPIPVTVSSTKLYESSSATQSVGTDDMKDARVEANEDTLTISHEQELPPI
jgi:hypothetical protein